ncbi:hypothetical protein BC833DRAFT_595596 [Globomyces pollinis-pini]|nr:hypothetical protein BC833DRAFT_595596 [Globomyces pollinis-pini]
MFDKVSLYLTKLLPQVTAWLLLGFIFYLIFQHYLLVKIIQNLVEEMPLDADGIAHKFELKSLDSKGFKFLLSSSITDTKLPFKNWWIKIILPTIEITDNQDLLIAYVDISKPFELNCNDNLKLNHEFSITVSDNIDPFKSIVKRLAVVGASELSRINVKIKFLLSIDVFNIFQIFEVPCFKQICLGDLKGKESPRAHRRPILLKTINDIAKFFERPNSIKSPEWLEDLLPHPKIQAFAHPGLRGVEGGLKMMFDKPPGLSVILGQIKFRSLLNGSTVSHCTVPGFYISPDSQTSILSMEVQPAALSTKPITGAVTTARGVLKGALSGIANGVLYGDWGGQAMILVVRDITYKTKDGHTIWWITEVLRGLEFEHDLDAVNKLKAIGLRYNQTTDDISEAIPRMVLGIVKESNCPIM